MSIGWRLRSKILLGESPRRLVLAAYRSTDTAPFRCPKNIVLAIADAVHDLKQCKFVDLHEAVLKALGEGVPDYHIRIAPTCARVLISVPT